MPASPFSRRAFLKRAAAASAGIAVPDWSRLLLPRAPASAIRVRGRVHASGSGLAGVGVTDGLSVVETMDDGTFELVTTARQPFVYLSLPSGYQVPKSETGTARFYQPVRADASGEATATFDLQPLAGSDERHAFVVLADPQTQNTYETDLLHAETVPDVQALLQTRPDGEPVFGVTCGDIMFDDLSLYPEYERAVQRMGVPFFQVIGNHDLDFEGFTDEASAQTFRRHFGPTYYSFDRGAVHYVVLDDVFWNHDRYFGYLDANQLAWLEADLARVEAGRPVVVFVHIPVLSSQHLRLGQSEPSPHITITNREALYRLLEPYQAHIISGHTHETEHVFEGGTHEHILGAACGAWWSGPIGHDGSPNGYALYEVNGESLRWRFKSTGHDLSHQLRTYAAGSAPKAPDEFIANVWDWDPEWTVVWYEGSDRRGQMAQRIGTDPLSEELHRGSDLPERRQWVEPMPTAHLFYAPQPATTAALRVEATDRWGETFSAALPRV